MLTIYPSSSPNSKMFFGRFTLLPPILILISVRFVVPSDLISTNPPNNPNFNGSISQASSEVPDYANLTQAYPTDVQSPDQTFPTAHVFTTQTNSPNLIGDNSDLTSVSSSATTTEKQNSPLPTQEIGFVQTGLDYWITAVMQIPRWVDVCVPNFITDIQSRLRELISAAVEKHQSRRYGMAGGSQNVMDNPTFDKQQFTIQVLNTSRQDRSSNVDFTFITHYRGYPMAAETLVQDLRLMNSAEQSALVGYPVIQMKSYLAEVEIEKKNLWIIGAVIGSVLGFLLCGWCLLFVYYNTCGRLLKYGADNDYKQTVPGQPQGRMIDRAVDTANMDGQQTMGQTGNVEKVYLISTHAQTDAQVSANYEERGCPPTSDINKGGIDAAMVPSNGKDGNSRRKSLAELNTPDVQHNLKSKFSPDNTSAKGMSRQTSRPATGDSASAVTTPLEDKMDLGRRPTLLGHPRSPTAAVAEGGRNGSQLSIDQSPGDQMGSSVPTTRMDDVWTLYPWRAYLAADQSSWLSRRYIVQDHQSISPDGALVLHSKLLTGGKPISGDASTTQPLHPASLLRLI